VADTPIIAFKQRSKQANARHPLELVDVVSRHIAVLV